MRVKYFTVLTLAIALFMSACGKSDADLTKAATDKLAADKVTGVTVVVKDGVATLTGEVADVTVKTKAEAAVKGVEGIKSVTNSATIADWDAYLAFVKENDRFDMLEKRCAKLAVEQYRAANDDLPPGVNWKSAVTVNVRRA